MKRKCDFCGLEMLCDSCNERVVPLHRHTCDLECARDLRDLLVEKSDCERVDGRSTSQLTAMWAEMTHEEKRNYYANLRAEERARHDRLLGEFVCE